MTSAMYLTFHLHMTVLPSLCNFRAKPTEEAKAESSRTPNVQQRPAAATAVPDPDDLFEDF